VLSQHRTLPAGRCGQSFSSSFWTRSMLGSSDAACTSGGTPVHPVSQTYISVLRAFHDLEWCWRSVEWCSKTSS